MTNITKAAQQALAALETCRIRSVTEWEVTDVTPKNVTQAIDALRAALQDKAGEVRDLGRVDVATAAYEIASALYFADNSDYVTAMRAALRCLAPDVEAGIAAGGPEASGWWHTASDRLAEARDGNKAQPAPVVPDDVARYQAIRNGLVYIEPYESGEIYVAGESGVYTKSGAEFDSAIDAIAASQQKGGQ